MNKFTIVKVRDKDDTANECPAMWVFLNDRIEDDYEILDTNESNASLKDLIKLCDDDAQDGNYHYICGAHDNLGDLLLKQYGEVEATKTMLAIAKLGGLHEMGD